MCVLVHISVNSGKNSEATDKLKFMKPFKPKRDEYMYRQEPNNWLSNPY